MLEKDVDNVRLKDLRSNKTKEDCLQHVEKYKHPTVSMGSRWLSTGFIMGLSDPRAMARRWSETDDLKDVHVV